MKITLPKITPVRSKIIRVLLLITALFLTASVTAHPVNAYPVFSKEAGRINVKVGGEVVHPKIYTLTKGSRLSDLLMDFWPPKKNGYRFGAILTRKILIKDQKVELIGISREVSRTLTKMGYSPSFIKSIKIKIRNLKPLGRTVIRLKNPILLLNTPYDIRLKNGDSLFIPTKPDYVKVEGAVRKPGKFKFSPASHYGYYLDKEGGTTIKSVKGFLYLLEASGKIKKIYTGFILWNKIKKRWELSPFAKKEIIHAGDIIFVPFNYGKTGRKLTSLVLAVYRRTGLLLIIKPPRQL